MTLAVNGIIMHFEFTISPALKDALTALTFVRC